MSATTGEMIFGIGLLCLWMWFMGMTFSTAFERGSELERRCDETGARYLARAAF